MDPWTPGFGESGVKHGVKHGVEHGVKRPVTGASDATQPRCACRPRASTVGMAVRYSGIMHTCGAVGCQKRLYVPLGRVGWG